MSAGLNEVMMWAAACYACLGRAGGVDAAAGACVALVWLIVACVAVCPANRHWPLLLCAADDTGIDCMHCSQTVQAVCVVMGLRFILCRAAVASWSLSAGQVYVLRLWMVCLFQGAAHRHIRRDCLAANCTLPAGRDLRCRFPSSLKVGLLEVVKGASASA